MKSNYPIILVHGILLKDTVLHNSFGKIPDELKKEGLIVYTSTNDGVGTIETNARQLKTQILKILKKEKCEKINIIAHSKGGLDAKYMITNLNMENKVASLTTICTPHKGSKMATRILQLPEKRLKKVAKYFDKFYKFLGDKKPNSLKACMQLQESKDVEKEIDEISDKIYCQSYSTVLKHSGDDFIMAILNIIMKKYERGKHDGVVSVKSSKFGLYKGMCIKDSISHIGIVDLFAKKNNKEKIYNFYKKVCKDLIKKGF